MCKENLNATICFACKCIDIQLWNNIISSIKNNSLIVSTLFEFAKGDSMKTSSWICVSLDANTPLVWIETINIFHIKMTRNDINQNKLIFQEQKYRKCVVRNLNLCFRIRTNVSCTTTAPWRTVLCRLTWDNTWLNVRIRVCSPRSHSSVKTLPKFAVVSERKSRINVGFLLFFLKSKQWYIDYLHVNDLLSIL